HGGHRRTNCSSPRPQSPPKASRPCATRNPGCIPSIPSPAPQFSSPNLSHTPRHPLQPQTSSLPTTGIPPDTPQTQILPSSSRSPRSSSLRPSHSSPARSEYGSSSRDTALELRFGFWYSPLPPLPLPTVRSDFAVRRQLLSSTARCAGHRR